MLPGASIPKGALGGAGNPLSDLAPTTVRRTSGDVVARFVRGLIYTGRLRAGVRVPQREVARLLSLSKIPVREGLLALEREGLVVFGADRGAVVSPLDPDTIHDGLDIFGVVYGYAARCALERGSDAFLERVDVIRQAVAAATAADDLQRLVVAFHSAVVVAAGSPRITNVLRATARAELDDLFREVPGIAEAEAEGVAEIASALLDRDAERAAVAYRRLLRRHGDALIDELRRRGLFETD